MTYIYSDKKVDNLLGCYIAPFRFKDIEKNATKVFTDDANIKKAYVDKCEVLPIKKKVVRKTVKNEEQNEILR